MNHKIKRKWCAALRGGTWTQIKNDYTDGDRGRCTLGVLMEVLGCDLSFLLLWMNSNLSIDEEGDIVDMNYNKPFPEIADWIEQNL